MDTRLEQLQSWLRADAGLSVRKIAPASSDASFRRYFRVWTDSGTYVVMDAPPDKENCEPFVRVSGAMAQMGLTVPRVLEADLLQGFLLLSDMGSRTYLPGLTAATVEALYGDATAALRTLQLAPVPDWLPAYDRDLLMREMALFRDWLLPRQLGVELAAEDGAALEQTFHLLADVALEQPRHWVHRDYHSRNLMITDQGNPGILDFQDAVAGPVTYDLVSLLRDCYIEWPRERVEQWAVDHGRRLRAVGALSGVDDQEFLRWFDLMGVQRHLKASGIFARLNLRDGKPGYLGDIPRTLSYIRDVSGRYDDLRYLGELLQQRVWPRLEHMKPGALAVSGK